MAKGIYLITGGASLIGSHIADQLLADGAQEVRLLDNRSVRSAAGTRLGFSREKAEREIGWEPRVSIEEGMRRLIEWQKGQRVE